ncbi:hypothetical protein EXIGLDRAFT_612301 [Exidia glandulosa HHB12029]|uniref:SMP-30/Gluconolactonase/LRE-like region domain-containing protein n=1 Tax=Exidia glandulosa HHB12029 TaxID=1314781 RepID=A0A166APE8_EXIGL|nr:hypothetical protein EXIGLDRAFT_612301 [Exidia glandulosa HHB12029]
MFVSRALVCLSLLLGTTQAVLSPPARTVAQWDVGTWAENIAVRSNGHLIVTMLGVPEIWSVDPFTSTKSLIATLTGVTGVTGIDELAHDVFAFAAGNFTIANATATPGSYSIWTLDLNGPGKTKVVKKTVDVPGATLLNGLTTLDAVKGDVLVSDSGLGNVIRVNAYTGAAKVVISDPAFSPPAEGPQLGINGIRLSSRTGPRRTLFFNNWGNSFFGSVPVAADGTATGPVKIIAHNVGLLDDFALSPCGAYVWDLAEGQNELFKISLKTGEATLIAGAPDSALIPGGTSVVFGRTAKDKDVLYVTTSGGLAGPINGTYVEGAKIVAFNVRGL